MSRHPFPNGLRASWWAAGRESCLPGGLQCGGGTGAGGSGAGDFPRIEARGGGQAEGLSPPLPQPCRQLLSTISQQVAVLWSYC